MRRKFVQIAAIFLAINMLPVSFASAGPDKNKTETSAAEIEVFDVADTPTEGFNENGADGPGDDTSASGEDIEGGTTQDQLVTPSDDSDSESSEEEPTTEDPVDSDEPLAPVDPSEPDIPIEPEVPEVLEPEIEVETGNIIRIGLSYGDNSLAAGNLLNSVGSGYRFGYHDGNEFYKLGYTAESGISILKTQNLYFASQLPGNSNLSGYVEEKVSDIAVGCYHLRLPESYVSFDQAKEAAEEVGGFPAWIKGEYQVRIGAYLTQKEAESAKNSIGIEDTTVVGTSSSGMTVVITGTSTPIFQYDGGSENPMFTVKPGTDGSVKSVTHFKGYKYYGYFRYERIDGGNLTVVNLVDIEDYVRGVLPYEMSPSWPLEALKAQAVTARSYTMANLNNHNKSYHFDLCSSEHCQVYYGTGGATAHTDQAAEETNGLYAWYDDEIILAVFHSNHGGATEDCENVWNDALPYLRGVVDPYEAMADKKPSYTWTKTFTGKQLQEILNKQGFVGCSEIVRVEVSKVTNTGNPYSLTFHDSNGKTWTISHCGNLKKILGLKTIRYTVSGGGDGFVLADNQIIPSLYGVWVLDGNGDLVQVSASPVYAMTANGLEEVAGSEISAGTFVFEGAGSGHNLGMSQWGAYAMAKQGFTYDEILKFYYTGIEIHE